MMAFSVLFSSNVLTQEGPKILLNGNPVEYSIPPVLKDNILYIPVSDKGTGKLIDYFGAQIIVKPDEIYINKEGTASRFKIGEKDALLSGKPGITDNPPFIENNITYLAFDDLARVLYIRYKFDESLNGFLLFPEIYSITFNEPDDGSIEILLHATSKIRCNTDYLSNGFGFVIEIPDCFVDLEEEISFYEYEIIEYISIVQMDVENPLVRMEIKLKKPVPIGVSSRIDLSLLPVKIDCSGKRVAEEWLPEVSSNLLAESDSLRTQLIKGVSCSIEGSKRIVKIDTTGMVKYEWHRMAGPDNRFYIDFSRSIFARNNIIPFEDNIISGIRLAKASNNPEIVRVIFEMKEDVHFEVYPSETVSNELIIEIDAGRYLTQSPPLSGDGVFGNMYSDRTVVIDPGHGGGDPGAIQFGMREKDLNLDISLRLEKLLTGAGYNVVMTRTTDTDVTWLGSPDKTELQARADVANTLGAYIFISIHNDSSTNTGMNGTCTFYYKDIDYELAGIIQKHLASGLGIANRGVKRADFYVLKHTSMSSVLVEVAFMSNSDNAALLATPEFRQKAAEAICDAVLEYSESFRP